jgi:hypothetical protein
MLPGCSGKPAWLNKNRMSSISELSSFAARLRQLILRSDWRSGAFSGPDAMSGKLDFEALALELFALQFRHNGAYRRLCEARGATPESVCHWTEIPAVPTSAFKEFTLSSLPASERTTVFHSSGTTNQRPSRHYHNAESLALYEASLLRWFAARFPLHGSGTTRGDAEPTRAAEFAICHLPLAILTPPPSAAPHSSLVHMFETIRREMGSAESRFLGQVAEDGSWALALKTAVALFKRASSAGQPLLVLGTAFSFVHLLDHLADEALRFELPPGSCALETGGYKGRSRALPKHTLHALITQRLGIPPARIVCEYGMSELSSQAYDFTIDLSHFSSAPSRTTQHASRSFSFPPWARVQLISPEAGDEVDSGETGLIRVFDLANVYSVMAIQTEDLGVRRADGFTLAGRAMLAEPRGCSLMAV